MAIVGDAFITTAHDEGIPTLTLVTENSIFATTKPFKDQVMYKFSQEIGLMQIVTSRTRDHM